MAASPGGKNVGRVNVRVTPDTSNFRKELKAQLEAIEQSLKIEIPVEFDISQASAAVAALGNQMNKVAGESSRNISKNFDASADAANRAEREVRKLAASVSTYRRLLTTVRAHWLDIGQKVTVVSRMIGRSNLGGFTQGLLRTGTAIAGVVSSLGSMVSTGIKGFSALASGATDAFSNIGKGFLEAGKGILASAGSMAQGVAQAVGSMISGMASAALQAIQLGLIITLITTLVVSLLAVVSALILSLPALVLAIAAPIAAIVAGFEGIKKAAKVLSNEMDHLQAKVSKAFEKGLTPVFKQLEKLFPVLERGLVKVADGVVAIVKALTDMLTSAQGLAIMDELFTNISKFLVDFAPVMATAARGFLKLAAAGSRSFDQLIGVMATFFGAFETMVDRIAANGVLAKAIEGMSMVVTALGDAFLRLMESGAEAMAVLGPPLSAFLKGFTDAFVALMPLLTAVAGAFLNVLGTALTVLAPLFKALSDVMVPLINTIGTAMVEALIALQPFIQEFIENHLPKLAQAFADLAPVLADLFVKMIELIPPFLELAAKITEILLPAFIKMLEWVQENWPTIEAIVKAVLKAIEIAVMLFAAIISGDWSAIWEKLKQILKDAWEGLQKTVAENLAKVLTFFRELPGKILSALGDLKNLLLQAGKDIVNGLITGVTSKTADLRAKIAGLAGTIKAVFSGQLKIFSPSRVFRDYGVFMVQGLVVGIDKETKSAVQAAKDLATAVQIPFVSGDTAGSLWAQSFTDAVPDAMKAVESVNDVATVKTLSEFDAAVEAEGFGDVSNKISEAMAGWTIQMDSNGLWTMVKKEDNRRARR